MKQFFAVYDAVAERYVDPFPAMNVGVALRGFEEACANPESDLAKHPVDYSLWLVADWDGELGLMAGINPAVKVAMATTFVHSPRDGGVFTPPDQPHLSEDIHDADNGQIEEIGS